REDLADDPRFATNAERVARSTGELDELVAGWFRGMTTAELVELLTQHEVPHTPIHGVDEVLQHDQVTALGTVLSVPEMSDVRVVGSPLIENGERAAIRRRPPQLGEHTDEVLAEVLGLSTDEIASFREQGALGP